MILVTGANGFIGGALVKRLISEPEYIRVVAAVRREVAQFPEGVRSVKVGDLLPSTDWSVALQDVDVVVHCAARVHLMKDDATNALCAYRNVNTYGALNLARQAAKAGVRRFVFVSSIKVNGEETSPGQSFSSDDMPIPLDPYGISKLEAEQGLREVESKTGMEVVIVRPTLVYGPKVRANFLRLLTIVSWGTPLPFGLVENKRSMVALDNLVDLLSLCIFHPKAAGNTFMVSDGHDLSTPYLITLLAQLMGRKARLVSVPPPLLRLLGTLFRRRHDVERLLGSLQVDIEHTRATLGWTPPITTESGLRMTVDWYLSSKPHTA